MKKIVLILAVVLSNITLKAQDLRTVLSATYIAFDTSSNYNTKVEKSNKLGLIAKKWNNEWITHYYASLSKTIISYMDKDANKRDAYLDEADAEYAEAVRIIVKDNDETFVLAAMIANARLAVDGSTRWMKYGKVFSENLENAKKINPNNPRIYYLQGSSKMYTPKAFGGGKKSALPFFEKAQDLFGKQPEGDITMPYWGKRVNEYYLAECKKEE